MCTRLQQGLLHRLRGGESSSGSSPEGFDELPHVPLLLCVKFSGASDRPELPLWSSSTPQDPAPSHIRGSQSLPGAIRLKTSITMVLEILCCVRCLSLPYAVLSLGLSLPNVVGQLLQGTSWDVFPCAFCRSGITLLLSSSLPYLRCASLTPPCPGVPVPVGTVAVPWEPAGRCTRLLQPPAPRGSVGAAEPPAPSDRDARAAGTVASIGDRGAGSSSAAQLGTGHILHPKAFRTSEQGVRAVGTSGRCRELCSHQLCWDKSYFFAQVKPRLDEEVARAQGSVWCPHPGPSANTSSFQSCFPAAPGGAGTLVVLGEPWDGNRWPSTPLGSLQPLQTRAQA